VGERTTPDLTPTPTIALSRRSEPAIAIESFDHVAIPSDDPGPLVEFYRRLGFTVVGEQAWRDGTAPFVALALGNAKINVHAPALWRDERFTLRGPTAQPGCGDLCFVWSGTVEEAVALVTAAGGPLVTGPVERVGGRDAGTATGSSVYTRDPDGNLVELITYGA
jgi:catechol 2,3-dioxygenase-like lactoylglutathione lyase family enzyme